MKSAELYERFGVDLLTHFELDIGHIIPTLTYGAADCDSNDIGQWGYDGPKDLLTHLLGDLKDSVEEKPENLMFFDQSEFFEEGMSMDTRGVVYVPTACKNDEKCRLHIHFHGCGGGIEYYDTWYVQNIGYN